MARDWLNDLWKASYKGASFWTERDQESGGRRIVKHQFPMRDDPFLEDLGEDLREFDLTAYLASDRADGEASALAAACASRGAGILVMPVQGPVLVRCVSFSRDSSKDRAGYIGFSLKCCREGASSALVSVAMSANLVFVAADLAAAAIASSFAVGLTALREAYAPDFVVSSAASGVHDVISTVEAIRVSNSVGSVASATQRNEIEHLFSQAPDLVVAAGPVEAVTVDGRSIPVAKAGAATGSEVLAGRVVAITRALGDAMPPDSAVRAFDGVLSDSSFASMVVAGQVYATPNRKAMADNSEQVVRLLRLAAVTAYCEAIARVKLADRPAGVTLRANVAEYFEAETDYLPASEIELSHRLGELRDTTVAYLSRVILDLAPVIRIEANQSMPSLFWAWRIYQNPQRSGELVARNRVVHPSFMPTAFEALEK